MEQKITHLRQEYARAALDEDSLGSDPIAAFATWMDEALEAEVPEPYAAALATASADGQPSARIVLCRGYGASGFVFYTNYEGRKGKDLAANPKGSLCFFWQALERQVRVEGAVVQVSAEESDRYFAGRPRESQIGAWTSPQSAELKGRGELDQRLRETQTRFEGVDSIPRPEFWGGYRLIPERIEFWQGRPSRLHDRLVFSLQGSAWERVRLAP